MCSSLILPAPLFNAAVKDVSSTGRAEVPFNVTAVSPNAHRQFAPVFCVMYVSRQDDSLEISINSCCTANLPKDIRRQVHRRQGSHGKPVPVMSVVRHLEDEECRRCAS